MPRGEIFEELKKVILSDNEELDSGETPEDVAKVIYDEFLSQADVSKDNLEDLEALLKKSQFEAESILDYSHPQVILYKKILLELNKLLEQDIERLKPEPATLPVEPNKPVEKVSDRANAEPAILPATQRFFNGFRYGILGGSGLRFGIVDISVAFKSIANNNFGMNPAASRGFGVLGTLLTAPVAVPLALVSGMFGALRSLVEPKFSAFQQYTSILDWWQINESESASDATTARSRASSTGEKPKKSKLNTSVLKTGSDHSVTTSPPMTWQQPQLDKAKKRIKLKSKKKAQETPINPEFALGYIMQLGQYNDGTGEKQIIDTVSKMLKDSDKSDSVKEALKWLEQQQQVLDSQDKNSEQLTKLSSFTDIVKDAINKGTSAPSVPPKPRGL